MTISFISLIFIWLLPLTANSVVTSSQNKIFTPVMTSEVTRSKFTQGHLTTPEASSLNSLSEVTGHYITSITADVKPVQEKNTNPSAKPFLQTTQTMPSKTFSQSTPNNIIMSPLNSSTVGGMNSTTHIQFEVTSATVVTSEASNQPTTTRMPPILSSSTQSQARGKTSTFQMAHPSTHPVQSTQLISTATTSIEPDKSTGTSPVTGGDAMLSTGLYKTSQATTKIPIPRTTMAKKRQDPPGKNSKSNKETNPGKAVAGIIGGALVLMMVGFLVIFIKKQKLQRQQISTMDWAGPSPFLEDGAHNGHATRRSTNQISLTSFLPQRLSKRLSLLPETDEELEDMTPGTTFGEKRQRNTFGQQVDGNDVQESNGTAAVVLEMKSTGDVPKTVENSASVASAQTNDPLSTNNSSEAANLNREPVNPPTLSGPVENAPAQLNDGLGQP